MGVACQGIILRLIVILDQKKPTLHHILQQDLGKGPGILHRKPVFAVKQGDRKPLQPPFQLGTGLFSPAGDGLHDNPLPLVPEAIDELSFLPLAFNESPGIEDGGDTGKEKDIKENPPDFHYLRLL